MKGTAIRQILGPLLVLLPVMQHGVLATKVTFSMAKSQPDISAVHHVYVVGSDPRGRASIGKALTRLGYMPSDRTENTLDATQLADEEDWTTDNRRGYSYTEITSLPRNPEGLSSNLAPGPTYILARQGRNLTISEDELSALGRGVGNEDPTSSWKRMMGLSDSEGKSLKLSTNTADAPSTQAENWVALCHFLGMGYSAVERLDLWKFP